MNKRIKRTIAIIAVILTMSMLMSSCATTDNVEDIDIEESSVASSSAPSSEPSSVPSSEPSSVPSSEPSSAPSSEPSSAPPPSSAPSSAPPPPSSVPEPTPPPPPPPPAPTEQMDLTPIKPMHYRNALSSDAERTVYDEILAGVQTMSTDIPLSATVSKEKMSDICQAIISDNPELFYLDNMGYYYDRDSGNATSATPTYYAIPNDMETAKATFNAAIDAIVVEAAKKTNRYDQVFYVHHAISDLTDFVLDSPLNQSAYSAVVLGKTVCAGYAKAAMIVLNRLGIETGTVRGTTKNGAHLWNVVKLNDQWYNLDINFDDAGNPLGKYRTGFILVADSSMKTHVRDSLSSAVFPACPKGYK